MMYHTNYITLIERSVMVAAQRWASKINQPQSKEEPIEIMPRLGSIRLAKFRNAARLGDRLVCRVSEAFNKKSKVANIKKLPDASSIVSELKQYDAVIYRIKSCNGLGSVDIDSSRYTIANSAFAPNMHVA